jgi:thiamine pyrophosphokinase
MRALLVCAAPVRGTGGLLPSLAAGHDLVVAVDGGGSLCLAAGVIPDVVLGDFDSLPAEDLKRLRELGSTIKRFPADKDATDLELAIAEVRGRGATTTTLTAAASGRADHTLAVLGVMSSAADLRTHLVEPDLDVWAVSPLGRHSLELTGPGATISLLAFGQPAVVSARGVVWELDSVTLEPDSSLGLSNRIGAEGGARVSVSEGVVLVFAPQVAGSVRAQGT